MKRFFSFKFINYKLAAPLVNNKMDPDFSNEPHSIKIAALVESSVFLAIWAVCLTYAMIRIKCSLERSGLIIIVSYCLNITLRVIFDAIRLGIEKEKESQ